MAHEPGTLHRLFCTPIYQSAQFTLAPDEREVLLSGRWVDNKSGNQTSSNAAVLALPALARFAEHVARELDHFAHEVLGIDRCSTFHVTQSWVNRNPPGSMHHSHKHPNSIISGVYFIDGPECPLVFQRDTDLFAGFSFRFRDDVRGYSSRWRIQNQPGRLVLFPSSLRHEVGRNTGADHRLTLSFNTFVTGDLGHGPRLTALTI